MKPECQRNKKHVIKLIVLIAISAFLVSCETVSYYTQAAQGQLAIVLGREDISQLINDPDISPELRIKFMEIIKIREFAENELALPLSDNYSTYVNVERAHVVWNVFAAPEFSTDPINWCYPVAGCVAYRGYFSESAALAYASQLSEEGFDVYTGGVDAYSTLGWFDDSVLSTIITRENYQLARLIFHELAHQIAYLPGDTTFNESFATTVEREGLRLWLRATKQEDIIIRAESNRNRQQQFIELVTNFRDRLEELYAKELNDYDKRLGKISLQNQLRNEYGHLKISWEGYAGYDSWFSRSLNNAQLSTIASYNDLVPFFNELLLQLNGSMPAFYAEVNRIVAMSDKDRDELLKDY